MISNQEDSHRKKILAKSRDFVFHEKRVKILIILGKFKNNFMEQNDSLKIF